MTDFSQVFSRCINNKDLNYKIKQHSVITNGYTTSFTKSPKVPPDVQYFFTVKGKVYQGEAHPGYINASLLVHKHFPVIYLESDPEGYHEMLIFPDDFHRYEMLQPDSLKWVNAL